MRSRLLCNHWLLRSLFFWLLYLKSAGFLSLFFGIVEGFQGCCESLSARWNQYLFILKTPRHTNRKKEEGGEVLHPSLRNDASPKTPPVLFFKAPSFAPLHLLCLKSSTMFALLFCGTDAKSSLRSRWLIPAAPPDSFFSLGRIKVWV